MPKRKAEGKRPIKRPRKKRRGAKKKVIEIYDEKFEVEAIFAAKMVAQKKWEYCVKWYGWPLVEKEYEPEEHLQGPECERLLTSFWAMSVCDRPDMSAATSREKYMLKPKVGTVIKAPEKWYKTEMEYYRRVVAKDSDKKREVEESSGEEEID